MLRFLCATVAFCFLFSAGASAQSLPQLSQADNESADPSQLHAPHHSPEATPAPHPKLVDITVDDAASNFCCPVPADDWYVRGEYLIWWLREGRIPSLLTTSSFASHGLIGEPDTAVLYGQDKLETRHGDRFVGARATAGYWLDDEHSVALEGSAFFLERDSTYFKATSEGDRLLALPYVNAVDGSSQAEIIAGPTAQGARSGGFNGYSRIELFGQEANAVFSVIKSEGITFDLITGARFLQMRDRLDLTSSGKLLSDGATIFGLSDHFRADNQFYGGQAGLRAECSSGRWFANIRGVVALGGTEQTLRTFGERIVQTPVVREVQPFGLYVLPSNSGRFSNTDFDAVYEVNANVGCRLTDHLGIFTGYTFLYWNNPIRAGDQVDRLINPIQSTGAVVGLARPAVTFNEDFFWAQGWNVGLELRW